MNVPSTLSFVAGLTVTLLTAAPAIAAPFTLDFETVPSFAPIADQYSALGVTFGGDILGLQNDAAGPYFSNAPSPLGVMAPVGPDATMNVVDGFTDFSFWYSSALAIGDGVQVWSALDGQGTLLASFDLAANAQDGCSDSPFCRWDRLGTTLGGMAFSVTFANAVGAGFDNLSVPEPTSAALALLGTLAMVALPGAKSRRRRGA